jgi:RNA polymerase sigma-70 factor (ECF subfamily)
MNESDFELLRATAAGDRDAFGRFVRRNTSVVLRFCLLQVCDQHGAEDATQEAMLRLYEQVGRNRVPEEPLPWLLAIARRCCQEFQRQRKRNAARPLREEDSLVARHSPCNEVPDLRHAMVALNDFEAVVLQLKHTKGLRCRQIGEQLGRPIGTVTAALSRAYAKLRAKFDRETEG